MLKDPMYCEKCDRETSEMQMASCGMCEECHEDYIQDSKMREYLSDCGYFTCPNGELWSHKDFVKSHGLLDWFTLVEAFRYEKEINND